MTEDEIYDLDGEIVRIEITIDYLQKYINLINNNWETLCGDTESHHVYPRSFDNNIFDEYRVNLSYADHLRAHYYLYKIFDKEYSMAKAFKLMMDLNHWEELSEEELEKMMPEYEEAKEISRRDMVKDMHKTPFEWKHKDGRKEIATADEMRLKYGSSSLKAHTDPKFAYVLLGEERSAYGSQARNTAYGWKLNKKHSHKKIMEYRWIMGYGYEPWEVKDDLCTRG